MVFKEEAEKLGAWNSPYPFKSPHAKFRFFNTDNYTIYDDIYDDSQFDVYMMCGLPGAGKDTWIQQHLDMPVISIDKIRRENKWNRKKDWGKAIQMAKETAREYCRRRKSFVWNATNSRKQNREDLIDLFTPYKARTNIIFLDIDLPTLLANNKAREEVIPESGIMDMLFGFELPSATEAHTLTIID
jgi:predicted kinase